MVHEEKNKTTINRAFSNYEYYTGKASENVRNLAFSGIAIIWIFTKTQDGISIPQSLKTPLILLCITLMLDFLQYVWGGLVWWIKAKQSEKKLEENDKYEPQINKWIPNSIHLFYFLKVLTITLSYILLIRFLINLLQL